MAVLSSVAVATHRGRRPDVLSAAIGLALLVPLLALTAAPAHAQGEATGWGICAVAMQPGPDASSRREFVTQFEPWPQHGNVSGDAFLAFIERQYSIPAAKAVTNVFCSSWNDWQSDRPRSAEQAIASLRLSGPVTRTTFRHFNLAPPVPKSAAQPASGAAGGSAGTSSGSGSAGNSPKSGSTGGSPGASTATTRRQTQEQQVEAIAGAATQLIGGIMEARREAKERDAIAAEQAAARRMEAEDRAMRARYALYGGTPSGAAAGGRVRVTRFTLYRNPGVGSVENDQVLDGTSEDLWGPQLTVTVTERTQLSLGCAVIDAAGNVLLERFETVTLAAGTHHHLVRARVNPQGGWQYGASYRFVCQDGFSTVAAMRFSFAKAKAPEIVAANQARAEAGDAEAQYQMGSAMVSDPYNDYAAARRWLTLAAEQGHVGAHLGLGQLSVSEVSGFAMPPAQSQKHLEFAFNHPRAAAMQRIYAADALRTLFGGDWRRPATDHARAAHWAWRVLDIPADSLPEAVRPYYQTTFGNPAREYLTKYDSLTAAWRVAEEKEFRKRAERLLREARRSRDSLERAAGQGDTAAQSRLAERYATRPSWDLERRADWYRIAAEQGHGFAALRYASAVARGEGIRHDGPEGRRLYQAIIDRGIEESRVAAFRLGELHEQGVGGPVDREAAIRLYRQSAAAGWPHAKEALKRTGNGTGTSGGDATSARGSAATTSANAPATAAAPAPPVSSAEAARREGLAAWQAGDSARALAEFRRGAELGDTQAQFHYAQAFDFKMFGATGGQLAAVSWYEQAARAGHVDAQYRLANIYLNGDGGVPKNRVRAAELFRQASEQGHREAPISLSWQYQFGEGVPKNDSLMHHWMKVSAERGSAFAMLGVGQNLAAGLGTTRDEREARRWYERAANAGNPAAELYLAQSYERGNGAPVDREAAILWYRRAAARGNTEAQGSLRRLGVQ